MEAYVTNLAKYTEGQLVGKWLEFPIDEDDFIKELESIGVSEGEEWFITDYDSEKGEPYEALGEYPSIDDLNEFAELEESEEFNALMEVVDYQEAKDIYENESYIYYAGMSLLDVAYEIVEECYDLPEEITQRYFDYKAFASDLGFDGYYETENGVIRID